MKILTICEAVAIIVTSITAIITLVITIIKDLKHAESLPARKRLEYIDDFGDFITNYGMGAMKIIGIEIFYKEQRTAYQSLVDLYSDELKKLNFQKLSCITYISNEEILNRYLAPQAVLRLIEINPEQDFTDSKERDRLLRSLCEIRKAIKLKITYTEIYGQAKTITI